MQFTVDDFENDFDLKDFIERISRSSTGSGIRGKPESFNPQALHVTFEEAIDSLQSVLKSTENRVNTIEETCKTEEYEHRKRLQSLQKALDTAIDRFEDLDQRVNFVATKVVHVGDQLEGVNMPRSHDVEAQKLMSYFSEYMADRDPLVIVVEDPNKPYPMHYIKVAEAADIIQNLYHLSQDLPTEGFENVKSRINEKYKEVENRLKCEFAVAHQAKDVKKMKDISNTLAPFKGYNQCIEDFITACQRNQFTSVNAFDDILRICERAYDIIKEVFSDYNHIMATLVENIFDGHVKEYVHTNLDKLYQNDKEKYLKSLYDYYDRFHKVTSIITKKYDLSSEVSIVNKSKKSIFGSYMEDYISVEVKHLRDMFDNSISSYYSSIGHQKRQIATGGLSQAFLKRSTDTSGIGDESLVSQEVAINMLSESRNAILRCHLLAPKLSLPNYIWQIFEVLLEKLCLDHISYAIDISLQMIPSSSPNTQPDGRFCDVSGQANAIIQLLKKHFNENVLPVIGSTAIYDSSIQKRNAILQQLEEKIDQGLEKSVQAAISWLKHILSTEQKKTDFRPEDSKIVVELTTPACSSCIQFIRLQRKLIKSCLDGKNVEEVLKEFGVRFHRILYDHLQQFAYNSMGGMFALADVHSYQDCIKEFQIPLLDKLFSTLHALCKLLVTNPENIRQLCCEEQLASMDRNVLQQFANLRTDYKTARLAKHFQ
ncbi:Exocyst complex component 5 [Trichoplax sp. H2]|nr:Exocyst complex component 5 [Trichoplax sp. H2]|eukprot:RDD44865.1 Exocyst complex component 5 [Trichoplax sp. H2]